MKTCPNCNKELAEGARFCDACGAQVFETVFCPNCGEQTSTEFDFCQKCGAALAEEAESPASPAQPAQEKQTPPRALPKKTLLLGGIGAVALVVIILVVSLLSGGGSSDNYSLYLKDGEICYTDYSEDGTLEITSRLANGEGFSNSELTYRASGFGSYIAFSSDGNRIFFPDRIEDDGSGITLYYRNINKPEEEAVKIDSDVVMYAINSSGTKVAYVKGWSDGILYIHDLTDKEKIASGVESFAVASDLKKISYLTDEGDYYLWYADKDPVKLASDVDSVEYVSDDLSVLYYTKDGGLYKQVEGAADKEKIASDVSYVVSIYDSGEVYYTKAESTEKNLMDYVEDDMAAADADVTKPEYPDYPDAPDYPYWWHYDTDEEFEAAQAQYEIDYEAYETLCDQIREEYDAAYDAYWAKYDRDCIREELRSETMEKTEYTLYYFDGSESAVVTDALVNEWSMTCASDAAVMVLKVYNQSEVQKVKLSEVSYTYEVSDLVEAALYSSTERYVASGAAMSVLEQTEASYFKITSDGKTVYFLDDVSDEGVGDLYRVTIADGQAGKPEMYDSDVSETAIFFATSDKLVYYKDVRYEDYKGDLYVNGEEIDYDVSLWDISCLNDAVLYYTDWNSERGYGTLKMCDDGTKTKIADDVHDFAITGDGDILYLYDYSANYCTGTLYLYNGGKPVKIDDDVIALIPLYNSEIRGEYYGW